MSLEGPRVEYPPLLKAVQHNGKERNTADINLLSTQTVKL